MSSSESTPPKPSGTRPKRAAASSKKRNRAKSRDIDSDHLDDDSDSDSHSPRKRTKRNSTSRPRKKVTKYKKKASDDEYSDIELEEGQEIVGRIVNAPSERAPPGQISQHTLSFLKQLEDPDCNDRDWFKLHDPVYRAAGERMEEKWTDLLIELDPQIPPLPPKDVIHRIYRDIRFSNDKTPYKTNMSASWSRSDRKGIFAAYHVYGSYCLKTSIDSNFLKSGGGSLLLEDRGVLDEMSLPTFGSSHAVDKIHTLNSSSSRTNIQRNPQRLRNILEAPEFVALFGEASPGKKGERRGIFGRDDELKSAPKGVAKDHPDIDLLKCRSFAVAHKFSDSEVLDPNFLQKCSQVATVMRPLVHTLNDMMTIIEDED
ncbi:hypothetical protein DL96DRAFT_1755141 [Flagelloscypha sp. PMI_526]|nr:hypothetical protein DL96DRAFT_1755141 [Flagelloscypha sp. PMI_526]